MNDKLCEEAQQEQTPKCRLKPNGRQELPMWIWGVTAFVAAYAIMQVQGLG